MTMPMHDPHATSGNAPAPIGRFTAARIREADFPEVRRGYDQATVRVYLNAVATEVEALHHAFSIARNESDRHKDALRRWQSEQASTRNDPQSAPPVTAQQLTPAMQVDSYRTPQATQYLYHPVHERPG